MGSNPFAADEVSERLHHSTVRVGDKEVDYFYMQSKASDAFGASFNNGFFIGQYDKARSWVETWAPGQTRTNPVTGQPYSREELLAIYGDMRVRETAEHPFASDAGKYSGIFALAGTAAVMIAAPEVVAVEMEMASAEVALTAATRAAATESEFATISKAVASGRLLPTPAWRELMRRAGQLREARLGSGKPVPNQSVTVEPPPTVVATTPARPMLTQLNVSEPLIPRLTAVPATTGSPAALVAATGAGVMVAPQVTADDATVKPASAPPHAQTVAADPEPQPLPPPVIKLQDHSRDDEIGHRSRSTPSGTVVIAPAEPRRERQWRGDTRSRMANVGHPKPKPNKNFVAEGTGDVYDTARKSIIAGKTSLPPGTIVHGMPGGTVVAGRRPSGDPSLSPSNRGG